MRSLLPLRWIEFAIGISLFAASGVASAQQAPMTFRAVTRESPRCAAQCPEVVVAQGVIEEDTPQAFVDFEKQAALSPGSVIYLDSPGGNVVASMELGTVFRAMHAEAVVSGQCFSACVYALMGASRRVVSSGSRIGLHRMSIVQAGEGPDAGRRSLADPYLVALVARYAAQMGVDPALIRRAESLPPGVLRILTPSEIARSRLSKP
jgi:hypothetical protein